MPLAGNGLEHRSIAGAEAKFRLDLNRVSIRFQYNSSRVRIATQIPTRASAAHASSKGRAAHAAESHVLRARRPLPLQSFHPMADAATSQASVARAQAGVSGQEQEVAPGVFEGFWQWIPPNVTKNQPFTIRYQRSGLTGPPALMVHGFGGNWCASYMMGHVSIGSGQHIAHQSCPCTKGFESLQILGSQKCLACAQ